MVLWLGEALGIPKNTVAKARRKALAAGPHYAAECAAIRKVISWVMIEERVSKLAGRK